MNDTITSIKENKFLLGTDLVTRNYARTDDEETFLNNLRTQPTDWRYRTSPVNYTLNSQNYRTQSFEEIDWGESVVIFGCSMVFGVGLDDSETIDSAFYNLTGIPAVNMGSCSTSMMFSLYNSAILNKNYPTPKAVVQLWTGLNRCTYFSPHKIINYGSWNFNEPYNQHWNQDESHAQANALFCQLISKQLWQDKTNYYEATSFGATAEALGCDLLTNIDYARDLLHPGHLTAELTANTIATKLKL
jgi:hypothetical protein